MKEIIVIKDEQAIDEWKRTIACYVDIDNSIYKAKFEKVPETFDELKELCKNLKELYKNYNIEVFDDAICVLSIDLVLLKVYDDGMVKDSNSEIIADNRTPQQMWNIIKNLCEK